ncbi:MAG TPA: hypothetical protein VF469_30705 [Kofleriaceae bacterium]
MRVVLSVLLLLFVGIVGCGTIEKSSSEATSVGEIAGADSQSVICPQICGPSTEVLCQFSDGGCAETCNSCLCTAHGGRVVTSCHGKQSSQASLSQVLTSGDDSLVGGACGNTTCGRGQLLM